MSLSEGFSLKESIEGQQSVISFIREQLSRGDNKVSPAHAEIVNLPFSAVITTNWDDLLEQALARAKVPFEVVVDERDISLNRSESLPVIKLYGSVSRGKVRGSVEDLLQLFRDYPLLGSYVRVLCAQRTPLFVGYNLDDTDFMALFRIIRQEIGPYLSISYATSPNPSRFDIEYWSRQQVQVIRSDPVDFLQKLNVGVLLFKSTPSFADEAENSIWMDNPFFRPLFHVRTLPSVNQVVDGVLVIVLRILDSNEDLREIGQRVIHSIDQIVKFRPNYASLIKLSREAQQWFPPNVSNHEESRLKIERLLTERRMARKVIGERGAQLIEKGDTILLYSQSTCVNSVINTWLSRNKTYVSSLHLVIPEIRPKSPTPFQDAFGTIQAIENPLVSITLIPDASIGHMIEVGGITKVFIGVDKILEREDGSFVITNVTGTLSIVQIAARHNLPVFFFGEESKVYSVNVLDEVSLFSTQFTPEERIGVDMSLPETQIYSEILSTRKIRFYNPGYDDIDSHFYSFSIITEQRELRLSPTT